MSRRLIIRPEAEADIIKAAVWYEAREPGLGLGFTSEIHAAIERAFQTPLLYLHLRETPHVRRILVRRFPYRAFYIVRVDAIVLFAVLHAAQHERHWEQRMKELQ
ncbi:MAG: type II toxin-antitoxin system RelE/ParE family toxin [Pyrinomonadaceae bacterium]|nr:type II toxin-antitoxin system RelE/ParE family toxin [Pyrinomonadaceae bacterium]